MPNDESNSESQPPTNTPEVYKFIYENAQQAMDEQMTSLREMRQSSSQLITVSALVAGLIVGIALRFDLSSEITATGVSGFILLFVGVISIGIFGMAVWWPTNWWANANAQLLMNYYGEGSNPATISEIHRDLALWLSQNAEENRYTNSRKSIWLRAGIVLLIIEMIGSSIILSDIMIF